MGVLEEKIKARLDDARVRRYFKPWYRRTWGRVLLIFLAVILSLVLYFIYLTISNYIHIRRGDIYSQKEAAWLTPEQYQQVQKEKTELITEDHPWLGAKEPLIFIAAYESLACPYCKGDQPEIKKMLAEFGTVVRFITVDFPTEGLHPNVFEAHLAAACANEQGKYWEYRELLFANQENFKRDNLKTLAKQLGLDMAKFTPCLDQDKYNQKIRENYASGVQAGVIGTPSYIINGNLIPGAINYDTWKQIIAYILKENF
ncbi:MAG: hypothetical protein C3F02_03435 [Parcubacteria group bacterium]|nr:MAG: hypothetical protein C3F02_03435 [Parcubacteria group bacterium]